MIQLLSHPPRHCERLAKACEKKIDPYDGGMPLETVLNDLDGATKLFRCVDHPTQVMEKEEQQGE